MESTDEGRNRGGSVIFNGLFVSMLNLKCKGEGTRRNERLCEGAIRPYIKNMPSFFKKVMKFFENITSFLENTKAFLQHSHTYGGIGLHVYTRKLTRIYASDYTDVRISLRVYMSEVSGSAILTFILCTEMYLVVQICTLCHKR